ncbi:hypothetical protein [Bradyrhizobium sp. RDI18]|uniref:hypothetical protein n=1 Tax=Bradyrhizobium sp. RDI18 TaxID=3367400 RepID=UPI00371762CD
MGMKEEFKKGCQEGGGSFVENRDGTFQCNTTSGLVIKCQSDGNKCWIEASVVAPDEGGVRISVDVAAVGIQTVFALPAPPTKPGKPGSR